MAIAHLQALLMPTFQTDFNSHLSKVSRRQKEIDWAFRVLGSA
jgi:hypothetical protein